MKKLLMTSILAFSLLLLTGCDSPFFIKSMKHISEENSSSGTQTSGTINIPNIVDVIHPTPTPELTHNISSGDSVTLAPDATPLPNNNTTTPTSSTLTPSPEITTNAGKEEKNIPTSAPTITPVPWNTPTPSPTPSQSYQIGDLNFQYYDYTKEIGVTESILEYNDHTAYSINYPSIGIPTIDNEIDVMIKEFIKSFDNEYKEYISSSDNDKAILHIDYTSSLVGNAYASIVLFVEHYSPTLAHPHEEMTTHFFDLKTGFLVDIEDIFKASYLPAISRIVQSYFTDSSEYSEGILWDVFSKNTAPVWSNYSNFNLTDKDLTLYFNKYSLLSGNFGHPSITFQIAEMKEYLKIDISGTVEIPTNPLLPLEGADVNIETPKDHDRIIDPDKPMIALTFDDGPSPEVTNRILDVLEQNQARASFFVIGNRISSYPEVLQRIVTLENEIGNHSYTHPNLSSLSLKEAKSEIKKTNTVIEKIVGFKPKYIRPPYGSYSSEIVSALDQKITLWSVDTLDWKTKDKDMIVEEVLKSVKDGSIILMHDIYISSAEAIEYLVPTLMELGYQLVTLSELAEHRGDMITVGDVIIGKR